MTTQTALIVDDEPDIRDLLEITLTRMGITTYTAPDLASARELLQQHNPQLCLTDMNLPDGNGIDLVHWIQQHTPCTPVAVITAYGSMDTAIESLKAGAFDFVSKPVELPRLRELVNSALKLSEPQTGETAESDEPGLLLGDSPQIRKLRTQTKKLARSQAPVFISGESGSGKERVARLIHGLGPRREKPFVAVNCGAIPSELMESEFFGHRKGSFTGAVEDRKGLFREADGGTLFLDEVADLPLHMQVKLLRAIQEKTVRPVGESREVAVNLRILCATHRDLGAEMNAGRFRQDLYYRLNVIEAHVPPLRERTEDIPALVEHVLRRLGDAWETPPPAVGEAAMAALCDYDFPGNVRELENILERAMTLCEDRRIEPAHLHLPAGDQGARPEAGQVPGRHPQLPLEDYLQEIEKREILRALDATHWNRTAAARKLGMTFRSLRYRLKKLELDQDDGDDDSSE